MLVEERLGNLRGAGQVLGGGLGEALAREERQRRLHNGLFAVFRRHAPFVHGAKVSGR